MVSPIFYVVGWIAGPNTFFESESEILNFFVSGMRIGFVAFAVILILALAVSLCGGRYEELEVAD